VTSPNTPNGGAASSTPKTDTGSLNSADPPGTSVFVYSPDIYCYIATENNGVIDVSPDIIAAQVKRVENQASQASVSLNNSKGHYSFNGKSIIQPMDKIIIYLSKIQTVKVFSGYVDTVPFLDLYPTTCDIQATCTLKRLLYTYWDPGLTGSQIILDQTQYGWRHDRYRSWRHKFNLEFANYDGGNRHPCRRRGERYCSGRNWNYGRGNNEYCRRKRKGF
jgi:hypothetical protein